MSKDDAPTESKSTVYQSALPDYAEPYFKELMERAFVETKQPYAPYQGQRIAGLSSDQEAASKGYRDLLAKGSPWLKQAGDLTTGAMNQAFSAVDYTPIYTNTGQWPDANVNAYMNPYITNVLDRLQGRANDRYLQQQGARDTAAERSGAYGGSRQAIQDFLAQRELNQEVGDIEAEQLAAAYQNAQGMWTGDQGRRLQSDLANQGVDMDAARLGLQGTQIGSSLIEMLGGFAQSDQDMLEKRLQGLFGVGDAKRVVSQAEADKRYADFVNQRDQERGNLNFLAGILRGVPVTPNQDVITTTPGPSPISQMLGASYATQGRQTT